MTSRDLSETATGSSRIAGVHRQNSAGDYLAKLMGDAPDVRERRRDVPTEVAEMVARCLEREPANRMASAAEVAQSLRAL